MRAPSRVRHAVRVQRGEQADTLCSDGHHLRGRQRGHPEAQLLGVGRGRGRVGVGVGGGVGVGVGVGLGLAQHLLELILAIQLGDELVLEARLALVDEEVHDRLGHRVL